MFGQRGVNRFSRRRGPTRRDRAIATADRRLAGGLVTAVGAVEITVHGWDIAEARRCRRPIPPHQLTRSASRTPRSCATR